MKKSIVVMLALLYGTVCWSDTPTVYTSEYAFSSLPSLIEASNELVENSAREIHELDETITLQGMMNGDLKLTLDDVAVIKGKARAIQSKGVLSMYILYLLSLLTPEDQVRLAPVLRTAEIEVRNNGEAMFYLDIEKLWQNKK